MMFPLLPTALEKWLNSSLCLKSLPILHSAPCLLSSVLFKCEIYRQPRQTATVQGFIEEVKIQKLKGKNLTHRIAGTSQVQVSGGSEGACGSGSYYIGSS